METLRDVIPEKEPWEKRRWVVLMYQAVKASKQLQNEHKEEPTDEQVAGYINTAAIIPSVMDRLEREVSEYQDKEFNDETGITNSLDEEVSAEESSRAQQAIKERYLAIDQDPTQNRAFLDPILFPEK